MDNLAVHVRTLATRRATTSKSIFRSTSRQSKSGHQSQQPGHEGDRVTGFNLNDGAIVARSICRQRLAADNRFYFTCDAETPAKALIVESASRGRSGQSHLQSALTTNDDLPVHVHVEDQTVSVDRLALRSTRSYSLNESWCHSGSWPMRC